MFDSLTSSILLVALLYFLFVKKTTTTRWFTTTAVQTTHRLNVADAHLTTISYTGISIPQQQQAENPLAYRGYRSKRNKTTQYSMVNPSNSKWSLSSALSSTFPYSFAWYYLEKTYPYSNSILHSDYPDTINHTATSSSSHSNFSLHQRLKVAK